MASALDLNHFGKNGTLHRNALVALLAPSLGQEKATQLVIEASTELGLSGVEFGVDEAGRIFDHLAQIPGLTGITASLARSRLGRLYHGKRH